MRHFGTLLATIVLLAGAQAQTVLYATSFENPPFVAGQSAADVDGWVAGSGAGSSQSVSSEVACDGSQSLKWDNSGTLNSFYSIRRLLGWNPTSAANSKLIVRASLYISSATQANRLYGVYLTGTETGTLGGTILGVTIGGDGKIRVGTTWSATYSSSTWLAQAAPGTYTDRCLQIEITYDLNPGVATIKVSGFSDGAEYTATLQQFTPPVNINLGTDYVTTTDRAGIGYFDSLEIIEAPGTPFEGWDETDNGGGDAGDLPATAQLIYAPDQTPCGSPVTRIRGYNADNDVDMYVIYIQDPANFSASTVGGAAWDTQLWLFNCDGTGVAFNDDADTVTQSTISGLNQLACAPQPGVYLLAISRYNRDAVDANGQLLWNNTPFTGVRCPDGPGAANPVAGWTGTTSAGGRYVITLQGAYFVTDQGCAGTCPGQCEGDANRDGTVNDSDLLIVLFNFGQSGFNVPGDVNGDGTVNDSDLLIVLFNFGCGS